MKVEDIDFDNILLEKKSNENINDVYESYRYCYFKHYKCWLLLYYQWNQQKRCHKLTAKCQFDRKKESIIKHKNLLSHIKLGKKDLTFGDVEIEKYKFYRHKSLVSLRQVNIEKILVFNKISLGEKNCKYFIGFVNYSQS